MKNKFLFMLYVLLAVGGMTALLSCEKDEETDEYGNSEGVNIKKGLVAYYTFDDETANDVSGHGHDGALIKSPSFVSETVNGKGKALFLNGTKEQFVNIPYNPVADSVAFSVSMWVKDFGSGILLASMPGIKGPSLMVTENGKIWFYTGWNGDGSNKAYSYDCTSLQSGGWHMITVTIEKGTRHTYLYIDGVLVDNTVASIVGSEGTKMQIGGNADGQMNYWTAPMKVDNVRIYNRCINAKEVKKIYQTECK